MQIENVLLIFTHLNFHKTPPFFCHMAESVFFTCLKIYRHQRNIADIISLVSHFHYVG